jgi:hypothetical protein
LAQFEALLARFVPKKITQAFSFVMLPSYFGAYMLPNSVWFALTSLGSSGLMLPVAVIVTMCLIIIPAFGPYAINR